MSEEAASRTQFGVERIAMFTDAVMAIAITLLTIDIRLPDLSGTDLAVTLPAALGDLWPQYLSFIVSFFVIGSYWLLHHRLLTEVSHYDRGPLWLNLVFLFCIAILPFTSSVIGEYGDTAAAGTVYALSVFATGLSATGLRQYAARRGLLRMPVTPAMLRQWLVRGLAPPLVFLLSIPVFWLVSPTAGMLVWLATVPMGTRRSWH